MNDVSFQPLTRRMRMTMLTVIVVPFLVFVWAVIFVRPTPINIALFIGGWLITGFGITGGLHRYFTHGGYKTSPAVEVCLGIMGLMSWMGRITDWVANHLAHHQHSDTSADLHSPHAYGDQELGGLRGFFHAHIGWMVKRR